MEGEHILQKESDIFFIYKEIYGTGISIFNEKG